MTDHRAKRPLRTVAVLALGLGLGAVGLSGPAAAQFFGGWGGWDNGSPWDGLGPQQIRRTIAERGFRVLGPMRRNGSVFVVDVRDPQGRRERLIVAAADAQILQRFLVDDGRGAGVGVRPEADDRGFAPRGDGMRGFAARGTDDERGLVPPADIPDGRRFARPAARDVPAQRFGDLGDDAEGAASPTAPLRRAAPPIRTVKPRPRIVERTPEATPAGREPGVVESTPLAPAAPRAAALPSAPVAAAKPPAAPQPGPVVASRPEPATAVAPSGPAVASAPPATASRRMTDPLAIPAGDPAKPVRSVASGITGASPPAAVPATAPAAAAPAVAAIRPAPAKANDVPVAPLD